MLLVQAVSDRDQKGLGDSLAGRDGSGAAELLRLGLLIEAEES